MWSCSPAPSSARTARSAVTTGTSKTVCDVNVIFNQTAPAATEVSHTLQTAVSNPNNTYNLTIDANSVVVSRK